MPHAGSLRLVGDILDHDVPTCRPGQRMLDVRAMLERPPGIAVVVNDAEIVLGLLEPKHLDAPADSPVETVMGWGPATVRPSQDLEDLVARLARVGAETVLVTSPDGRLLGRATREHAERDIADTVGTDR